MLFQFRSLFNAYSNVSCKYLYYSYREQSLIAQAFNITNRCSPIIEIDFKGNLVVEHRPQLGQSKIHATLHRFIKIITIHIHNYSLFIVQSYKKIKT